MNKKQILFALAEQVLLGTSVVVLLLLPNEWSSVPTLSNQPADSLLPLIMHAHTQTHTHTHKYKHTNTDLHSRSHIGLFYKTWHRGFPGIFSLYFNKKSARPRRIGEQILVALRSQSSGPGIMLLLPKALDSLALLSTNIPFLSVTNTHCHGLKVSGLVCCWTKLKPPSPERHTPDEALAGNR